MRILFLCHRFPLPAEGGGKIRSLYMVRHLAAAGHDVTLCSLIRDDAEARGAEELAALGVRVESVRVRGWLQAARTVLSIPTARPSSFGFFYSGELARRIETLLGEPGWDLIIAYSSSMGPYVAHAKQAPKIMDFVDMDSQKWLDYSRHKRLPLSLLYALEGKKLEREERRLAAAYDCCTTISVNELQSLAAYGAHPHADWFPNGVDLDYFAPDGAGYDPDLVAFVGRMDYYPNEHAMLWFCEAVWPALRARRPSLKLRIIGSDPPRSVRALARLRNVEVTGFVPDVRPHVGRAALSVAPLAIARGMQNKVLESMAMGVPVITSARVAEGLDLGAGSPVKVAAVADEYVEHVLAIVGNPVERMRLSRASRELVERTFSWPRAMAKLDEIIAATLARAREGSLGRAPAQHVAR